MSWYKFALLKKSYVFDLYKPRTCSFILYIIIMHLFKSNSTVLYYYWIYLKWFSITTKFIFTYDS